ncbi:rhodanese-like domain-containing protein [uncultured Photobacterium sp.]|uniref:rhodanese-like domain-containing protein n=1 Tax=uncultured Photobacterium sp. TaxID=173973 RepID=UPI002614D2A9|nr:rhodanese-like domain-containing protein [uncultured Photobacterium sp.]
MRSILSQPLLFSFLFAFSAQAEVVTPEQFWQEFQQYPPGQPLIIDVRTNEEFITGHLPQAINIPHQDISKLTTFAKDKTQPIFIYCRSGRRSEIAENAIAELGYKHIYNGESYETLQTSMPAALNK